MAEGSNSGGSVVAKRNLRILKSIVGDNNCISYHLTAWKDSKKGVWKLFSKLSSYISGRMNGISKTSENEIIDIVNNNNIANVFVDSSLNGYLVRKIKKKTNAKVTSFFHNCEYSLIKQGAVRGEVIGFFRIIPAYLNEKLTVRYSDKFITLNSRDHRLIESIYKKGSDQIIPISLNPTFHKSNEIKENALNKMEILFVGSNFFPNIQGISWFIKNVLPFLKNTHLSIVGKDLAKVDFPKENGFTVFSDVESLEPFYEKADIVVVPIFSGGGMKVKVAEALMYGKNILVSSEALNGYENIPTVTLCETANDYIDIINRWNKSKYSQVSYDAFLTRFSDKVVLEKFISVL